MYYNQNIFLICFFMLNVFMTCKTKNGNSTFKRYLGSPKKRKKREKLRTLEFKSALNSRLNPIRTSESRKKSIENKQTIKNQRIKRKKVDKIRSASDKYIQHFMQKVGMLKQKPK